MAFTPRTWRDKPDRTTPLDAANLIDLETRLSNYTDTAVAAGSFAAGINANSEFAGTPRAAKLASPYSSGTALTLDRTLGATGRMLIGVDVGTTSCELALVSSVSGTTLNIVTALSLSHSSGARVEVAFGGDVPAWWFGAVGSGLDANDDQPAWQQAMATVKQSGLATTWINGQGRIFKMGSPLVRPANSRIRNAIFQPTAAYAPADPNNAMQIQQSGALTTITGSAANTITTAAAHGLGASGAAFLLQGNSLPSSLVAGRVYYACNLTTTTFRVASTLALALANTPDITFGATGSGTVWCSLAVTDRIFDEDVQINMLHLPGVNGLISNLQQPGYSDKLRISNEGVGCFGWLMMGQDYHVRNLEMDGAHLEMSNVSEVDFFGFDIENQSFVRVTGTNPTAPFVHVRTSAQVQFRGEATGGANGINFWGCHHEVGAALATTTVNGAGQTLSTTPSSLIVTDASSASVPPPNGHCIVAGVKGVVSYTGITANTLTGCTIPSGSYTPSTGATVAFEMPYCVYDLEGPHHGIRIHAKRLAWPSVVTAGAFVYVHTGAVNNSQGEVAAVPYVALPSSAGFVLLDDVDRAQVRGYVLAVPNNSQNAFRWGANGLVLPNRAAVANANYTAVVQDAVVAYTSISAAKTVTLPDATQYPGQVLVIKDESGSCSTGNTITLATTGGQTIDGAATLVLNVSHGSAFIYSNGVNWFSALVGATAGVSGSTVGAPQNAWLPSGAKAETFSRMGAAMSSTLGLLSSGRLWLVGIGLPAGIIVSTISFESGTTALTVGTGGSNQVFALYDSSRNLLGVTGDDTTTAWGAGVVKTLTLAAPYTTLASGAYYLGIWVVPGVGGTVPTLRGVANTDTNTQNLAPAITGNSTTGLTNPASAPNPAAAPGTVTSGIPWAYVS